MTAFTPAEQAHLTTVLADVLARHGLNGADMSISTADNLPADTVPADTVQLLLRAGDSALELDDLGAAAQAYQDGLQLAQLAHLPGEEAAAMNRLSGVMSAQGQLLEALRLLEEAHAIYTRLDDRRGQAVSLCNIGGLQASMDRFDQALHSLQSALHIAEQIRDVRLALMILNNIGGNYSEGGYWEDALRYFREGAARAERHQLIDVELACRLNESDALLHLEQLQQARETAEHTLHTATEHGLLNLQTGALDTLGRCHEHLGDWPQALHSYRQARELARATQYAEGELKAVLNMGRINALHDQPVVAIDLLREALELAGQLDHPKSRRDAHHLLSGLYKAQGELGLALTHFEAFHAEERALLSTERDKTTRTLMMRFEVERAQTQTRAEREQREHAEELQARAEAQVIERTAELEQAQMEVVTRLAMAAEFRDDATGEHTRRVGIGAALIAERLGLPTSFVDTLRIAARLHDVGKIGIPDAVLLKAGKLSAAEFEDMKRHTVLGARLLSGGHSEVLQMARQIALTHHERWDGTGYPQGLSGTEIPLSGRIVALADVFDALTHRRPYKLAWDRAETLAELARQRGRHFDPELTGVALSVFGSARYEAALAEQDPEPARSGAQGEPGRWTAGGLRTQDR